ncbi:MAG: histidine phosphatase family protein [Alphaproteobacteria bacterium]|nr:MAG: histidine phosphatase family protein [Alphaproteobacteria bacterium]
MTQFVDLLGYERIVEHATALTFAPKRDRFIFVRHGETEGDRTKRYQLPHTPLNETGEGQAKLAAKALAQIRIGKLVASPMARAWRTASLVAAEHGIHPEVDGALSERFYVSLWDTPIEGAFNWDWDPDGCEPLSTFVHRAAQSVMRILADDAPDGETVIVAHGGILLVTCALTRATLENSHRRNAVPLRFSRENGAWTATPL